MAETKDLINDPQVVLRRSNAGVGAFGLYVDYIVYERVTGKLARQERFFLVGHLLCKYVRTSGNSRAAWKAFPLPDHGEARALLLRNLSRYEKDVMHDVQMVHRPLVVELTSVDIDAIKKHEPPMARHEGGRVTERAVGKIDDETWLAVGYS